MRRRERDPAPDVRTFERGGFEILVGKGAHDNDVLTFDIAEPNDLWLHVSGWSGSHVVVRTPDGIEPPRDVVRHAAALAAWYSKARGAKGKIEVHVCRAGDVRKPRRSPPGKVELTRWEAIKVYCPESAPDGPTGDDRRP